MTKVFCGMTPLHFHSAEPFSAENLIARIPVQVKGRSLRWKKSINEYSIKRAALENYAKEGGIAYFVVDTANRKTPVIYYNLLTLVDIRHLFHETRWRTGITSYV